MEPQVVNPAAETMLGVSQISAATVADLVRQNDWLGRMVGACLESGQDLGDMETVLTTGPRELTIRVEVSPLLNAEGRHCLHVAQETVLTTGPRELTIRAVRWSA